MTLLRSLFLAVATAAAAACSSGPSLPDSDAEVAGTLTEFLMGPAYLGAPRPILVEGAPSEPHDRTIVHVETSTRLYLVGRRGQLLRASADDLGIGDQLQVWTTGVEMRSYPGQVTAVRIHISR